MRAARAYGPRRVFALRVAVGSTITRAQQHAAGGHKGIGGEKSEQRFAQIRQDRQAGACEIGRAHV